MKLVPFISGRNIIFLPLFIFLYLSGCTPSLPPFNIKSIENIDLELHKNGAAKYSPVEYNMFTLGFRRLKDMTIQEEARLSWFRDYEKVHLEFKKVEEEGKNLLEVIKGQKDSKKNNLINKIAELEKRREIIDKLTVDLNSESSIRAKFSRGVISLSDAGLCLKSSKYDEGMKKAEAALSFFDEAERLLTPLLKRYSYGNLIDTWKRDVANTLETSRKHKSEAIIVNKSNRSLLLYENGNLAATFDIGLGKHGYKDKIAAGDRATPEGRYKIIKKNGIGESKYHKALLLNYPNEEDIKRFRKAKKDGTISKRANIGGLIEIHGGGKDSITYGCVALENEHMDKLFDSVSIGTPVTIVGATSVDNEISRALKVINGN